MTSLLDMVKYLGEIAPQKFTIGGHDSRVEIGPQTATGQAKTTVKRVVVATYPSARVITTASQEKANLLITLRPLFPFAIDQISGLDLIRVRLLTKNYISAYSIGSSFISARDGICDALVEVTGLNKLKNFSTVGDYSEAVPLGRICEPPRVMNHSRFVNYVASKLSIDTILFSGDLDDEVKSVLLIPGDHIGMTEIIGAKREDVKTVLTGDLEPGVRMLAHEEELNTLEVGAFVTENPGMRRLRHQLSLEFPELKIEYTESISFSKSLRYPEGRQ